MTGGPPATLAPGSLGPPGWICEPCRERRHDACLGHGQCMCQHRNRTPREPVTGPPGE